MNLKRVQTTPKAISLDGADGGRETVGSAALLAVAILGLGAALGGWGFALLPALQRGRSWQNLDFGVALAALCVIVGAAIVLWWVLSFVFSAVWLLLAARGRLRQPGPRLAPLSPVFMRKIVAALLGLNLSVAGVLPGTEPLAQASSSTPAVAAMVRPAAESGPEAPISPRFPDPDSVANSPTSSAAPSPAPSPSFVNPGAPVSPSWPVSPEWPSNPQQPGGAAETPPELAPQEHQLPVNPGWQPTRVATPPGVVIPTPSRGAEQGRSHVVLAGESLWSIAAAGLGSQASDAEIARQWPQWYLANQAQIGPDPNLILPGQVLTAPLR